MGLWFVHEKQGESRWRNMINRDTRGYRAHLPVEFLLTIDPHLGFLQDLVRHTEFSTRTWCFFAAEGWWCPTTRWTTPLKHLHKPIPCLESKLFLLLQKVRPTLSPRTWVAIRARVTFRNQGNPEPTCLCSQQFLFRQGWSLQQRLLHNFHCFGWLKIDLDLFNFLSSDATSGNIDCEFCER